jgi:transcriptional regulator with XRE-family HTH domain
MDAKSLGPVIRKWRIESGLSQKELGEKAELPKRLVGSFERGEQTPDRWEIVKLCDALGRDPAELITFWYRSFLNELNQLGKLRTPRAPQSDERTSPISPDPGSRVDQIIDQIAALAKDLYRESKSDFQKPFLGWLSQSGPSSSPLPSPPRPARKRVSRKRGSTKV